MGNLKRYLLTAAVAFLAALAAMWIVRSMMPGIDYASGGELHKLVHKDLDLDTDQKAKVAILEQKFTQRRKLLDEKMREANAALAVAIASEHAYGPKVAQAVDRSHIAMGELQKATLAHVFAIRATLRPGQARRFDIEIARVLTNHDPR